MKILVLTSTFPRWANDTDPRFVFELSNRLAEHHQVDILAPNFPGGSPKEKMENLSVHRYRYFLKSFETLAYNGGILPNIKKNPLKLFLIPFFLLGQYLTLSELIKNNDYDIIHAHWIIPQGIIATLVKKHAKKSFKFLITSHGGDLFSLQSPPFRQWKKWAISQCDHITVVSNAMKTEAIKLGCPEDKISVSPMGVDLDKQFIPPSKPHKREGLIFVGRLVEKKGVEYLIRAFQLVLKQHPNTTLTIIGDGPRRKHLENLAKKLNIMKAVTFTGSIENHLIPAHLQRARIAVAPSIITESGDQEGLGLTIIEALGCGCAVIASNLDAIKDIIIDKSTGLIVEQKSPSDLYNKINSLLLDPERERALAHKGREHCQSKFNWNEVHSRYQEINNILSTTDDS